MDFFDCLKKDAKVSFSSKMKFVNGQIIAKLFQYSNRTLLAKSEESFVWRELHRAAKIRCLCSFLESNQEVHDLPDLGKLSNPFTKLLHVRLQPFER